MATFTEQLDMMRVPWRKGSKQGEINICCPFCVDRNETQDFRFRLGLNTIHDKGSCFNCGYKSREITKWVMWKLGVRETLEQEAPPPKEKKAPPPELPDDFEYLHRIDEEDATDPRSSGLRYLLKRGFTRAEMKRYKIGVTLIGRYAYRILFPVLWRGKLRGIVARDFTGRAKAKYLNSVGDKYLWNLPEEPQDSRLIVLAEGCFKAIAIERALPKIRATAVLGHSVTVRQLRQLKFVHARNVLVWPDPDKPGIKGMISMCETLQSEGFNVRTIWPTPKKQADEMTERAVCHAYKRSRVYDWQLQTEIQSEMSFN